MATKLLNLIALSTLAILATSFGSTPVNALSLSSNNHARSVNHAVLAKKRAAGDRPKCKPRPSSGAAPKPTGGQSPPAQPAPSSSPAPAPAPPAPAPAPPNNASGGKGLLAWGAGPRPDLLRSLKVGTVSSVYNWGPYALEGAAAAGYDYIPMVWGTKDVDYVKNNIKPGQYKAILGFNEPDHGEQGNMDPYYAASVFKDVMAPLRAGGTRVVSPAVTNGPSGKDWWDKFIAACGGIDACGIDAIAVHVYSCDTQYVKSYIESWNVYGKPLWLTEFACMDFVPGASYADPGKVASYAGEMGSYLKNAPFIEKYAPFMIADNLGNVNPNNKIIDGNSFNNIGYAYYT